MPLLPFTIVAVVLIPVAVINRPAILVESMGDLGHAIVRVKPVTTSRVVCTECPRKQIASRVVNIICPVNYALELVAVRVGISEQGCVRILCTGPVAVGVVGVGNCLGLAARQKDLFGLVLQQVIIVISPRDICVCVARVINREAAS